MTEFKTDVEKAARAYVLPEGVSLAAVSVAFKAGAKFGRERGFQRAIDQVAEMFEDESCIDHEAGGFCIATRVRELGKRHK